MSPRGRFSIGFVQLLFHSQGINVQEIELWPDFTASSILKSTAAMWLQYWPRPALQEQEAFKMEPFNFSSRTQTF